MLKFILNVGNDTALQLVKGYQRHLSPIKGFKCASGHLYGDTTCSAAIKAIIQRDGVIQGFPAMQNQLKRCHHAARLLAANPAQQQAGVFCCILPIPL